MQNKSISSIDRRGFLLGVGTLLGVLGAAGCDSGDEPGKATGPPLEKGNRKRLEMFQEKGAAGKDKTKK